MKVLIVFAHPEELSLNASLRDIAINQLEIDGHEVKVSNLYKQNFKPIIDRDDFKNHTECRLKIPSASSKAFQENALTEDVLSEQEKLLWADAVILQFPLWWFSMPAILKGWVERVFSFGFAYGVGEHSDKKWGNRYGEGVMAGKRAMLLLTIGGWAEHYSEFGINGQIDDLLFPINHGILFYPGFDVLPHFAIHRADRMDDETFEKTASELRLRMAGLFTQKPIAYCKQNFGDYTIPDMQLKPSLRKDGFGGIRAHIKGN